MCVGPQTVIMRADRPAMNPMSCCAHTFLLRDFSFPLKTITEKPLHAHYLL